MKDFNPTRALAIGAGAVIIALTGAAFWLSYAHLAEVALGHGLGQAPARAWAWPATLDLFIVAGELLMLRAALARRVDPWAIGLTAAGSVGSIVLNVAGVTGTRDPGAVPLLDYVVAAVPPTAALLAFGALMRQIHQALAGQESVDHVRAAAEVTVERADEVTIDRSADDRKAITAMVTPPVICSGPSGLMPLPLPVNKRASIEPRKVVVPEVTAVDPWADKFPFQTTIGNPPAKAPAVPAAEARQVVTAPIVLTPTELRQRARRLHRRLVKSGERGVTIDRLREEFGLSRREATDLRRDVLLAEMMTGGQSE
ncbi:DUF2637 domain-containing protein [Streptomyces sp. NPDC049837]|uniref:DUF2637 domain-containing protein n=1 Tax=Streptomyces sp. NPDC049837 TaxID=3155277 RepID=UPI003424DA3F